ncbi:hypothetical protein ZIOFF_035254 [Zingiber officinale]|uniref:Retrotransposon gag domain-containing protein n=1 Tax=Zingiber officinale TaxID=94328 RepID=A0A8J5G8L4_ZINOF|nr:hypothetical protein ZIOFF_035254 [Zingiber officinale]
MRGAGATIRMVLGGGLVVLRGLGMRMGSGMEGKKCWALVRKMRRLEALTLDRTRLAVHTRGPCSFGCAESLDSLDMPPRRSAPQSFPPLPDAATRILEGMAQLLEQHASTVNRVIFRYMNMADTDMVRCAIYLLKDDASIWLKREFMCLRQGALSVTEFVKKFDRGCHFVLLIANDATEKLRHFLDGLRPTIRRDVLLTDPTEYNDAVTRAYRAEQSLKDIEWEMQRKRPSTQQQQ